MNRAYIANIDIRTHDKPSSFVRCLKLCCLRYQHVERLWCFRFVSEASLDTILKHWKSTEPWWNPHQIEVSHTGTGVLYLVEGLWELGVRGPQGGLLGVHCDAVGDLQGTHPWLDRNGEGSCPGASRLGCGGACNWFLNRFHAQLVGWWFLQPRIQNQDTRVAEMRWITEFDDWSCGSIDIAWWYRPSAWWSPRSTSSDEALPDVLVASTRVARIFWAAEMEGFQQPKKQ